MSSLRSILGGSNRIKKPSKSSRSSSWADSLPCTKPGSGSGSGSGSSKSKTKKKTHYDNDDGDKKDYFNDRLDDCGLVKALATDLTLRDVPQAMRYMRERMWTPMPEFAGGMNSTRTTEVLNFRRNLPPVVTSSHLQALLRSPTAVDRETDELIRAGTLRKVVVLKRGGIGEVLVTTADLEKMLRESGGVDESTREVFLRFLRCNPAAQKVSRGVLTLGQADQLVRAGFLTMYHGHDFGTATRKFARPENKGTMLSLETVSRAAAGSMEAVGGEGAVHAAGGSGGGSSGRGTFPRAGGEFSLAIPGNGAYLKLVSAALSHLSGIFAKSPFKELPETMLRERWDGGVARFDNDAKHAAKRDRREFSGVLPGRTRKWREFYGLSFDWVLHEAVGAGLVEVFETRTVGRGVRLL